MKKKLTPRNPFVALAKFRKAGFHTKQTKSLRRQDKQVLRTSLAASPGRLCAAFSLFRPFLSASLASGNMQVSAR